jgi:hypothetical protein
MASYKENDLKMHTKIDTKKKKIAAICNRTLSIKSMLFFFFWKKLSRNKFLWDFLISNFIVMVLAAVLCWQQLFRFAHSLYHIYVTTLEDQFFRFNKILIYSLVLSLSPYFRFD